MQVQRTRRYRCALIPADMPADQVEIAASAGRLPTIQFRAPHADYARATAAAVTGKRVYEVQQLQEGGVA
ncbi:hypothetical protein [Brachymonas sp.]|uniref:hypothetical protein n=1 Tax=Brachymonas sp. TaxID=1936292 RepID=UPI0035B1F0B3